MNSDIFFLGLLFAKNSEAEILKNTTVRLQWAANSFQWALIDGIEKNLGYTINIVNCLPVGTYPSQYKQILLKNVSYLRGESEYVQLGTLNLPLIKQWSRRRKVTRFFEKYLEIHRDKKIKILIYSMYEPFLSACSKLKKKYKDRVTVCPIVPDLPLEYGITGKSLKSRIYSYFVGKQTMKSIPHFDCYVLLTEHMRRPLQIENKPYALVEGVADTGDVPVHEEPAETKTILYTGGLHKIYSIDILLKAFSLIPYPNYRLQLCGWGDMVEEIVEQSKKDPRIIYYGAISQSKVKEMQAQATVLVNSRQDLGEYTKYSFPSKTMGYMMSGAPVIIYHLPGIPSEYYSYVYTPNGNTAEDLAEKIIQVCEMPKEKRMEFGERARQFILNHKSETIQAKKILDMLQRENNDKIE